MNLRLALGVALVFNASFQCDKCNSITSHEPNKERACLYVTSADGLPKYYGLRLSWMAGQEVLLLKAYRLFPPDNDSWRKNLMNEKKKRKFQMLKT